MQKLEKRNTYPPTDARIKKHVGNTYNRLTIMSFSHVGKNNHLYYECKCLCGNIKNICLTHLTSGKIKSCGCLKKELDYAKHKKDSASKSLYRHYKQNAKYKNREFSLTFDEFLNITSQNCFYCGRKPISELNYKNRSFYSYNGIDRKDNIQGYTKNNALPCCSDCNYFKSNLDYDKFLEMIKRIYEYKGLNI